MSDIKNENDDTDINNEDDQIIDWEREAIFYQNALEMALSYQRTLGQTISQLREMSTDDQGKIFDLQQTIEQQKMQIARLEKTNKEQNTYLKAFKEKAIDQDKSLHMCHRHNQEIQARLRKSEERKQELLQQSMEKHQAIDELKTQVKLLQKILRQQKEDSSQS